MVQQFHEQFRGFMAKTGVQIPNYGEAIATWRAKNSAGLRTAWEQENKPTDEQQG